jgi:hypothetical protein
MRTVAVALAGLALAGCFKPTWRRVEPGMPLGRDTVILVGSFAADPPVEQHKVPRDCGGTWVNGHYEPPGKVVFVQETDGNVMAFFTRDLSEPFEAATMKTPSRAGYDWFYVPLSGHFFMEVPRAKRLNLRGFTYITNAGSRMFGLPAFVDLSPKDRFVYVGEIRVRRGEGRRATFVNAMDGARKAARQKGLSQIADAPWTVRLLQTPAGKPSVSPEFGNSCTAEKGYWKQLL